MSENTAKLSSPILLQRTVSYDADTKPPRRKGSVYLDMADRNEPSRRRRSSSILQVYHEPPETLEQISDQAVLPNLNANWTSAKGAWTIHIVLIALLKIFYDVIPGVSQETSWTLTNMSYMFGSYLMFHYVRGVPFEFNGGAFDNLNMWEQIDNGAQYTPTKKFLLSVPIVLFLLSTHYTHYDLTYFVINFLAVLAVVIPKLPFSIALIMKEGYTRLFGTDAATADKVSEYANAHSSALPEHILSFHDKALQTTEDTNMLSSNYQSKLHLFLAHTMGAKRVLEIGVFLGYSAMLWAHAVGPDGVVTGLEYDAKLAKMAGDAIAKAGVSNVEIIVGDGAKTLPALAPSVPYDLVFLDADKTGYGNYLNIMLANSQPGAKNRLLRPGALIIADNVLRRGFVADPSRQDDAYIQRDDAGRREWHLHVEAVQKFNQQVVGEKRLESFLVPLWDGVTIMRLLD